MLTLDVSTDLDRATLKLAAIGIGSNSAVNRAVVRALNNTLFDTRTAMGTEIERAFDKPTEWTKRSPRVKRSTPNNLSGEIGIGLAGSGRSPREGRHLIPHIEGGGRPIKGLERALQSRGLIPPGWYAMPGAWWPLDQYGNMRGADVKKLLSTLGLADYMAGYDSNQTPNSRRRNKRSWQRSQFRVIGVHDKRPGGVQPGIYARAGRRILPLVVFVQTAPRYQKRLRFYETAERIAREKFPRQLDRAIGYELAHIIAR